MAQKRYSAPETIITNPLELGKLPPQAIELEEAVLGAILVESDAIIDVIDILRPESFYKEGHQLIYAAVLDLVKDSKGIDLLMVTEQLRKNKELEAIGGPVVLVNLTSRVASGTHIEQHARIVQQKYIQRELIRVSSEIQNQAFDESIDVADLIDFAESELMSVTQQNVKKEPIDIATLGKGFIELLDKIAAGEVVGILSGHKSVDEVTGGYQAANLIIIAARPGMGKTSYVLAIAKRMAFNFNKKVAIFSLEMSGQELTGKLFASISEIESCRLRKGKLTDIEWQQINQTQSKLETIKDNIFIDDTGGINLMELRAKSRRLKARHGVEIIIIDYLQLMTSSNESKGNREQEVSNISRGLKALGKELEIPIICLSQLNRSVESRPDKRPQLSDLRESGAIEQDADVVQFIHRPEYYGFTEDENMNSLKDKMFIMTAKNRHGKMADSELDVTYGFTDITDPSEIKELPPINDNTDLTNNEEF